MLRLHPPEVPPLFKLEVYQLVTKMYITKWNDGLIRINPALQQNYVSRELYP